ncbi:hypothetical protein D3C72_1339570 [compost metagenome]
MEVAVHQHLRLAAIAGRQQGEDLFQRVGGLVVQRHAMVLFHIPLGKEGELVGQAGGVVGGQAGGGRLLQADQRGQRFAVHRLKLAVGQAGLDALVVGLLAQVGQQQQSLIKILCQHLGHVQAGVGQQLAHVQEGTAVFVGGGRVHDNQGALAGVQPEVAAETGVGGGRAQRVHGQAQGGRQAIQPVADLRQAGVVIVFQG